MAEMLIMQKYWRRFVKFIIDIYSRIKARSTKRWSPVMYSNTQTSGSDGISYVLRTISGRWPNLNQISFVGIIISPYPQFSFIFIISSFLHDFLFFLYIFVAFFYPSFFFCKTSCLHCLILQSSDFLRPLCSTVSSNETTNARKRNIEARSCNHFCRVKQ
jgi:hypothetical protein